MAVKPVPEGYHTVVPYLIAKDADTLLTFVKQAFGAKEKDVMRAPDGSIWHAEVVIGDSHVMISNSTDQHPPTMAALYLYIPDVDATYRAAVAAGGTSTMEPADQFYGDRTAGVKDPLGNDWWMGTHVEDVSPEELKRRAAEVAKQRGMQPAAS
jgi:uncharacterized glyoxalase superfamily protein PhnB